MRIPAFHLRPLAFGLALTAAAFAVQAQEKVVFATNWKAQAGHGGFYQALVDGTYKKYGLDVDIQQGGPMVNNRPMLPAGKVDFLMTGNLLQSFDNVKNGVPTVVVAAFFQKDPQVLIAHDDVKKFEDLKGKTLLIGAQANRGYWPWLKAKFGLVDEQTRPYTFNIQPFVADKNTAQQGYLTSEPYAIQKAGVKSTVLMFSDHGFPAYATTAETRNRG